MVGVPGRSKACHTCRRRKKGCDFRLPACSPCLKAGIECEGYKRQPIFVNSTTKVAQTARRGTGTAPESTVLVRGRYARQSSPDVTLRESLLSSARQELYAGLFLEAYLPYGKRFTPEATAYSTAGWMSVVEGNYRNNDMIKIALMAVSLSTLGRKDQEKWMLSEGLRHYGDALRRLAVAMNNPGRFDRSTLILASRLLAIFEFFGVGDQDKAGQVKGWVGHNSGEMAIIRSTRPEMYRSGDAHKLFADARLHMIISCSGRREKCELSSHEWKTVPWSDIPKTPKDLLLDILVETPELLYDIDCLTNCVDFGKKLQLLQQLVKKAWSLERELQGWLDKFGSTLVISKTHNEHTNTAIAHLYTLFWATRLQVQGVLKRCTFPPSQLPAEIDPKVALMNLLNLFPILMDSKSGWFGIQIAAYPLGVALRFLEAMDLNGQLAEQKKILLGYFQNPAAKEIYNFVISSQKALSKDNPGEK